MSFADFDLTGRRALITGSTDGIGLAIALRLARAGASVVLHSLPDDPTGTAALEAASAIDAGAQLVTGDMVEPGAAAALLARGGPIDILVSNVAIQVRQPLDQMDTSTMERHFTANFVAALQLVQGVLPHMKEQRWGRIVNIGSIQQVKPHPELLTYAALKAGQKNLIENLARQLAVDGITANTVAPGVVLTARNRPVLSDPVYAERVMAQVPLRSFGEPEDVAGAVLLLCSQAGRYITGANIPVDGGMHL
ncbi:SDR family NAD(P)-dependent oxidoreductase [Brevundimonas sp. SL161]|uniref:SDR family NAD(P)-dependent oxidoreductase n=1 Tax=Brevundimonas sp. SL161 TaxID=2804613 RepID=UPI003CED8ADE